MSSSTGSTAKPVNLVLGNEQTYREGYDRDMDMHFSIPTGGDYAKRDLPKQQLEHVGRVEKIDELSIRNAVVSKASVSKLAAAMSSLSSLTYFSASNVKFPAPLLLGESMAHLGITHMYFHDVRGPWQRIVTDAGAKLTHLNLGGDWQGTLPRLPATLTTVCINLPHDPIKKANLSTSEFHASLCESLSAMKALDSLELRGVAVSPELFHALKRTPLRHLSLTSCTLNMEACKVISGLRSLEELTIWGAVQHDELLQLLDLLDQNTTCIEFVINSHSSDKWSGPMRAEVAESMWAKVAGNNSLQKLSCPAVCSKLADILSEADAHQGPLESFMHKEPGDPWRILCQELLQMPRLSPELTQPLVLNAQKISWEVDAWMQKGFLDKGWRFNVFVNGSRVDQDVKPILTTLAIRQVCERQGPPIRSIVLEEAMPDAPETEEALRQTCRALASVKTLRGLSCGEFTLNLPRLNIILELMQANPAICELDLSGSGLTGSELRQLVPMMEANPSWLVSLDLTGLAMSLDDIEVLAVALLGQRRLQRLVLRRCSLPQLPLSLARLQSEVITDGNPLRTTLHMPLGFIGGLFPTRAIRILDAVVVVMMIVLASTGSVIGTEALTIWALTLSMFPVLPVLFLASSSTYSSRKGLVDDSWKSRQEAHGHTRVREWNKDNILSLATLVINFLQLSSFAFLPHIPWPEMISTPFQLAMVRLDLVFPHLASSEQWSHFQFWTFFGLAVCIRAVTEVWTLAPALLDFVAAPTLAVYERVRGSRGSMAPVIMQANGLLFLPIVNGLLRAIPCDASGMSATGVACAGSEHVVQCVAAVGAMMLFFPLASLLSTVRQERKEALDIRLESRFLLRTNLAKIVLTMLAVTLSDFPQEYLISHSVVTVSMLFLSLRRVPASVDWVGRCVQASHVAIIASAAGAWVVTYNSGDKEAQQWTTLIYGAVVSLLVAVVTAVALWQGRNRAPYPTEAGDYLLSDIHGDLEAQRNDGLAQTRCFFEYGADDSASEVYFKWGIPVFAMLAVAAITLWFLQPGDSCSELVLVCNVLFLVVVLVGSCCFCATSVWGPLGIESGYLDKEKALKMASSGHMLLMIIMWLVCAVVAIANTAELARSPACGTVVTLAVTIVSWILFVVTCAGMCGLTLSLGESGTTPWFAWPCFMCIWIFLAATGRIDDD